MVQRQCIAYGREWLSIAELTPNVEAFGAGHERLARIEAAADDCDPAHGAIESRPGYSVHADHGRSAGHRGEEQRR